MGRRYAPAVELIHTCYRIGDIDRSVAFYEALGFEELGRMPIRDEAINVFMGLPGDGARLELTYNHGVDSYELGTGYNHIAVTVDDLDGTLERLAGKGIEPEKPPYRVREGGSRLCFVRDPDGYRIELIEKRLSERARSRSSTSGRTRSASSSSPADDVVEAHRRDPRGRPHRRGLDAAGELAPEPMERALETIELYAHFCRATGIDDVRPSRRRRSATPPTATSSSSARAALEVEVLSHEEEARYGYLAAVNSTTLADGVALDIGGGSMQLTRVEDRRATDRARGGSAPCDDRALPGRRARQAQAAQGAARARARRARRRGVAGRRRRAGRHRRDGPQPRGGGRLLEGLPVVRRPGLPAAREALDALVERARRHDARRARRVPGIKPERGDLILAGAVVIQTVMEAGGFDGIEVDRGRPARGRVLRDAARRPRPAAVRRRARGVRAQPRRPVPRRPRRTPTTSRELALEIWDALAQAGCTRRPPSASCCGRRRCCTTSAWRSTTTTTTSTRAT